MPARFGGQAAALLVGRALVGAAVFAPVWYWDGGLIEIEALEFIRHYLDPRGLLQKVFDPYTNDLGTYQARELSYFFDYLDARVFNLLIARGHVVFIPATAVVATLSTVVIFHRAARRHKALPPLTAALLVLMYLTNYVHLVTMGMFYRSSKPLLAPALIGTAFYVMSLVTGSSQSSGEPRSRRAPVVVFCLLCFMSLLDRQGYFYALVALGVLVCHAALAGGRRDVALAAAAAVVAMTLYNVWLAPLIVERVNGYRPSLDFQRPPMTELAADPTYLTRAGELLAQASAVLTGGVPPWICLGAFGLLIVLAIRSWATLKDGLYGWTGRNIVIVCLLVAFAQVLMFAGMIARHPPLWEHYDHRLWYYPLPFQALLLVILTVLIGHVARGWNAPRRMALNLILGAAVIGNVAQWGDFTRLQRQSTWFSTVYRETYVLKSSLNDGRPYSSHVGYRAFYEYCLALSRSLRVTSTSHP